MTWEANELISKADAIVKIKAIAAGEGYPVFKVYYDGVMIESPSSLPDLVDMEKITVGQKADQA